MYLEGFIILYLGFFICVEDIRNSSDRFITIENHDNNSYKNQNVKGSYLRMMKYLKKQTLDVIWKEAVLERHEHLIKTAAIISIVFAVISFIITFRILSFQYNGVNKKLLLLNLKMNSLEARLGTRQIPDKLLIQFLKEIGASYEILKNEREKLVQDVANDERKFTDETVPADKEAQYDTMAGMTSKVFKNKDGGSETPNSIPGTPDPNQIEADAANENLNGENKNKNKEIKKSNRDVEKPAGNSIKLPSQFNMANTADPAYETLHAVSGEVFKDKGVNSKMNKKAVKPVDTKPGNQNEIRPPEEAAMAPEGDPAYETLHAVDQNVFVEKKTASGKGTAGKGVNPIKPPPDTAIVATNDPAYQTLAALDNNVFVKK